MRVGIVGLGLIGGSLAKDLKALGMASDIIGIEADLEHGRKALELGLADKIESFEKGIALCDLVILSVPVTTIATLLPLALDLIQEGAVVIDMGSTKSEICGAVSGHKKRKNFVAAHPMAGTENSGPEAAISGLFTHKTVVICESHKSSSLLLKLSQDLFESLKMRVVFMEPEEHDLHAAYVSHLSHISSFVLANTVLDVEKNKVAIFDLAGGGFESTVRLAKSSPEMWAPIFEQNKTYVLKALSDYIDHLNAFKLSIELNDLNKAKSLMKEANSIRRVLGQMAERSK